MWAGLTHFLDDPRIPLDNNYAERGLRGVVLGRKNHYGSRSRRGTEVAALFYSLVESAKLCGVEPQRAIYSRPPTPPSRLPALSHCRATRLGAPTAMEFARRRLA